MSPFELTCEQELLEDCSLNTQSVKLGKAGKELEIIFSYYIME